MNIPLGTSSSVYGLGGGVEVKGYYILPFLPWTHALASINYNLAPTIIQTTLNTLTFGVGGGVNYSLLQNLHMNSSVQGGLVAGLYGSKYALAPYVQASADVMYSILPFLSLGVGANYKYYFASPQPLYSGFGVSVSTVLHLGRERAPELKIPQIEINPVFPVLRKFYDDNALGKIHLKNGEQGTISDVKVSFFVKQYMDNPKQSAVVKEMKRDEETDVPLYAIFTDAILGTTEQTKAQAEVTVEYTYNKARQTVKRVETLRILDRNAMTWDDDRKTAAFVTPKDPTVLLFSKHVAGMVRDKWSPALDNNFLIAMGVHEALTLFGIKYVPDPASSWDSRFNNKTAVDFLQFPNQTLQYRAGDCDDLSILYNALLESVGVETAFITAPGHIFTAFAVAVAPEDLEARFTKPDDFIVMEGKVWIPVEITSIGEGFLRAWDLAAKEWRKYQPTGDVGFFTTGESWKLYEPVGFQGQPGQIALPDEKKVLDRFFKEKQKFVDKEIQSRVSDYKGKIDASGGNPMYRSKLGTLYARYGMYPEAEKQYQAAINSNKYLPAIVNMGNVKFLRNDLKQALAFYQQALSMKPKDARILLNVAQAYHEMEKYDDARKYYFQAKELDPAMAMKYKYIETSEDRGVRGAEVESRAVEWDDQ